MSYYCLCAFPHECEMPTNTYRQQITHSTMDTSKYVFIFKAELYNQRIANYLPSEKQWGGKELRPWSNTRHETAQFENTSKYPIPKPYVHNIAIQLIPYPAS